MILISRLYVIFFPGEGAGADHGGAVGTGAQRDPHPQVLHGLGQIRRKYQVPNIPPQS